MLTEAPHRYSRRENYATAPDIARQFACEHGAAAAAPEGSTSNSSEE